MERNINQVREKPGTRELEIDLVCCARKNTSLPVRFSKSGRLNFLLNSGRPIQHVPGFCKCNSIIKGQFKQELQRLGHAVPRTGEENRLLITAKVPFAFSLHILFT